MRKSCSKIFPRILIVALAANSLFACSFSTTRTYQPLPRVESDVIQQANLKVQPGDVLNYPDRYRKNIVAWTGIIRDIEIGGDDEKRVARFTVEHRYFDWTQNDSGSSYELELSKRGEGYFATAWPAATQEDWMYLSQFKVGDMMIAYGYPSTIKNMVVGFYPTLTMRGEKPENFRIADRSFRRELELSGKIQ